jgi:hypothetical protein
MKKTLLILFTVFGLFLGCQKENLDGKNSLLDLMIEQAGENCSTGGYKIISGLDLNNNGSIDENEIQNTEYICNGDDGSNGANSLLNVIPETVGENCSSGGYKIISGIDLNNNNTLDENEILNTEYICNGDNGINGISSLINVIPEPSGDFCDYGGIRVESGLDHNNNGILDDDEINSINYICNGEDGQSSGEVSTIRLPFNLAYKWRSLENYWTSDIEDGLIYGFNKLDYESFDSIGFIAQFHRGESSDTIWLRLYDYTASQGISNSELFSVTPDSQLEDPDKRLLKSRNFANSILSDPRTIGIQFRKETTENRSISIHHAEIILNKSE